MIKNTNLIEIKFKKKNVIQNVEKCRLCHLRNNLDLKGQRRHLSTFC